jgi:Spy/CpxP family protein refolding chaperone
MKRTIFQAALVALLSASFLYAQSTNTPPAPPTPAQIAAAMVARLTTLLDLTSAQQASAITIFTASATTDAAIATQMQTAHTPLHTAVTSNSTIGITAAATTIGGLTTQQVEADAGADAAFYALLTADQQAKYATLQPPGQGTSGGPGCPPPGSGGPGGPPPGGSGGEQ